jgi:hypothetical protein
MVLVIAFFLLISSCAYIGPKVTTEEEKRAQAILMTEAQAWQKNKSKRFSRLRRV